MLGKAKDLQLCARPGAHLTHRGRAPGGLRRRPGAAAVPSGKQSQRGPPACASERPRFRDGRGTCARTYGAGALRTLGRALLV